MSYRRLQFSQYFIDTSEDYNHTGLAKTKPEYTAVPYACNAWEKKIGLRHEVNYALCYDEERDVIQIHFQKTNGRSDWFANIAEFASKYYAAFPFEGEDLELHVHHGWANMYKTIKYKVREEYKALQEAHPDAYVEIIGWSLGSGQAMLCAQDLNWNFGIHPYLYTYGSVRPFKSYHGNEELLDRYLAQICADVYNFANRNDIVTYMPPFKGFRMIQRENVGREKRTLKRLLNPNFFHTIYDRMELYRKDDE